MAAAKHELPSSTMRAPHNPSSSLYVSLSLLLLLAAAAAALGRLPVATALSSSNFGGSSAAARQLLFNDQQGAMSRRADHEEELLRPNMVRMDFPTEKEKRDLMKRSEAAKRRKARAGRGGKTKEKGGGFGGGRGGGFGGGGGKKGEKKKAAASPVVSKEAQRLHAMVSEDGVVMIPSVLSREASSELRECVLSEIEESRRAVEADPSVSVRHFNCPVETHDPKRGYVLLPFVDSETRRRNDGVGEGDDGEAKGGGPMARALRDLIQPGAILGELFETACGGDASNAVLYDWTVLRTEPGAKRQPIHYDTPHQTIPGLFCAFVALQDVSESMGGTMFLKGTHLPSCELRRMYDTSDTDAIRRDEFLNEVRPGYALLRAGDAAFFDMRVLHAGLTNQVEEEGGSKRIILALTFRNPEATEELGHKSNMRRGYVGKYTLDDVRREVEGTEPFATAGDGLGL